ncbi:Hormonally up-regulated neu tumor-associated kinase-like A [Acipenser ruthenus]|uniref:non-specific serine/threonine protein kinase n=1 Tax=Acipenser ruthenus TaxID=7906 RepID=A0A444UXQ8_ACIRT|nr:Hormonally up-regulated neu tumor-associated kinase-like A [Acipenser ruthenus]
MPAAVGGMLPERNGFLGGKSHIFPGESSLPSFLSCVSKEYLRNFQHNKRVGNYLIGRKLGEGSFAKVREGLHVTTGEKVAIKVIDKKKAKKDSYVTKNLRREGQIQQMIRHPNITQLLDILETENSYYLVMELCPGGNLMHKICEKKRLEEYEAQKYIRQLVMAVEHLHRAGVVHRDLKIENLLLDEENNIKLIDFGLSNCAGILGYSDPFSTQCGSPAYAAPELLSRKKYGPKVDVWSIGVNMYAMLIGTLPFTVEPFSLRALHQKMVDKEMNPLPVHLSPAAVNMLRNLLEPDPTKRPNIQQALAEQWLNENYQGKPLYRTPYPNRIHMKELNQSVLLHMTEKLGYKHSEVVNAVISNRACHTLTVYFLLNKKLERYLRELKERKFKEQERIIELQQTPWNKKIEKIPVVPKQHPCTLAQSTKALLIDKKPQRAIQQERALLRGILCADEASEGGCVTSCSLEYLEMQPTFPRTPQPIRRQEYLQQDNFSLGREDKNPRLGIGSDHSTDSVDREPEHTESTPWYKFASSAFSHRFSNEKQSPASQLEHTSSNKPVVYSTHVTLTDEDKKSPLKPDRVSSDLNVSYNKGTGDSGCPGCVKNRGRFPMMGIGQMLRKRNQNVQFKTEKPVEMNMPATAQSYQVQNMFCATGALKSLC